METPLTSLRDSIMDVQQIGHSAVGYVLVLDRVEIRAYSPRTDALRDEL